MGKKYFNEGYDMSPADYAKVLFENTNDNCLTLSRRNEDPFSDEYDKQYFESYTMNWNNQDLQEVINDFGVLYSELKNSVEKYGVDSTIEWLKSELDDKGTAYRATRLCRIIELGAPEVIINFEACKLMDAMIISQFAVS